MFKARILEKSEENKWDQFIQNHPLATIHQASQWGHFQAQIPARGKYWIIIVESPHKILAGTLLIRHKLPNDYSWLYTPRGPLLNFDPKNNYKLARQQMEILLAEIKKIDKEEKAIFLRIDPPLCHFPSHLCHSRESRNQTDQQGERCSEREALGFSDGRSGVNLLPHSCHFPHFHQNIHSFQPEHTLMLDLTMSEEELLKQMKPKGRYNIKLATQKGVKIRQSDYSNPEKFQKDLKNFYKILQETTTRDGFHAHDLKFYEQMLNSLNSQNSTQNSTNNNCKLTTSATLYLAEFNNQIIATSINTNFKDTATYYYGASGNTHRNLMAPYLLHWEAIKEAKKRNCKFYDFFGIAPSDSKNHPWQGVTEFKKKFGGREISYQSAQEFVFRPILYRLYKAYKKLRFLI